MPKTKRSSSKRSLFPSEIYRGYIGPCAYCNAIDKLTVDHIVPRSKGGTYNKTNVAMVCGQCNNDKADQDLDDWIVALSKSGDARAPIVREYASKHNVFLRRSITIKASAFDSHTFPTSHLICLGSTVRPSDLIRV